MNWVGNDAFDNPCLTALVSVAGEMCVLILCLTMVWGNKHTDTEQLIS